MGRYGKQSISLGTSHKCCMSSNPESYCRSSKTSMVQEAQTKQTFFEANFFSEVQDKGAELNKQEGGGRCQERVDKLPPLLLGLHFLELVALGLLTMHCVCHCHTLGVYLKQDFLKRQQKQLELELNKYEVLLDAYTYSTWLAKCKD